MKTLGVVFTGNEQLDVRELDIAEPGPGQVLVEVTKTLISTGTETICYQRKFAPGTHWDRWVQYPFPVGYSAAGHVLGVGDGVTHVKPGDRVGCSGYHAKLTLTPAFLAYRLPRGVSDEDATWGTLAYIVQHGFRKVSVRLGESVVVIGVGLLGQLLVQYARLAGASEVIAIDTSAARLAMAAAHGATRTLNVPVADAVEAVRDATGGAMAEVVFDMTGNAQVFAAATKLVRPYGRLGLIGDTGTPAEQHLTPEVIRNDLQIFAAHAGRAPNEASDLQPWSKRAMTELFYKYLAQGRMKVSDLITHRFRPQQAAEAYGLLCTRRDEAMGVIFDFEGG
jgi:2-desacetyl-2-hydroxyethyl bacteriochlorophyllide A dehydrogenase